MSESLHIVCPHCDGVNRVPTMRLSDNPNCGLCQQALFNAHPVELNTGNFKLHISRSDIPVLVDFWASWCNPCKIMAPAFVQAAAQMEPKIRLAKLDTEQSQIWAEHYNIRSIPTLALFRNGKEVARQAGAMNISGIIQWAKSIL